MRSNLSLSLILPLLLAPLLFAFGLNFDSLGFKFYSFIAMVVLGYAVFMVPTKWSLFVLFLYIGLEGFLKVISNYNPVIHVGSDLLVIALLLKVLFRLFFSGIGSFKNPPLTNLFLIHFFWLAIVLFNPFAVSVFSSIAGAKIYVSMFLLYFFGYFMVEKKQDVVFYMIPFLIVAVLHTLSGIYQGLGGAETLINFHPRYAVQLAKYRDAAFRPFGLTNLPGGPAVYMYQVFPFALYMIFYFQSNLVRLANMAFLPLSTFLFFLCQVRSAMLKMMVATSLFLIGLMHIYSRSSYRMLQRVIMLSSVVGILIFATLPRFLDYSTQASQSNEAAIERSLTLFDVNQVSNARKGAWARFKLYIQEVPFGAGFARVGAAAGAFKDYYREDDMFGVNHFFTDNLWVAMLVELGLPGMLIITILVITILWRSIRNYFKCEDESLKVLYVALLAPILALCLGFYGAEGLLYNPEACFFWFFSGILMKLPQLSEPDKVAQYARRYVA